MSLYELIMLFWVLPFLISILAQAHLLRTNHDINVFKDGGFVVITVAISILYPMSFIMYYTDIIHPYLAKERKWFWSK